MMGLERSQSGTTVERFGVTQKLVDSLDEKFADRGAKAARIVAAALSESPWTAVLPGATYSIPIHNVYDPQDGAPAAEDTVVTAVAAYNEGVNAKTPGARSASPTSFKTNYRSMFANVAPVRRDPDHSVASFNQALLDGLDGYGIDLVDVAHARKIVLAAPHHLTGFVIDRHMDTYSGHGTLVTEQGHTVKIHAKREMPGFSTSHSWVWFLSTDPFQRGGTAPASPTPGKLLAHIVAQRTAHQDK